MTFDVLVHKCDVCGSWNTRWLDNVQHHHCNNCDNGFNHATQDGYVNVVCKWETEMRNRNET